MPRETVKHLIRELGEAIEAPGLELDEDDYVCIVNQDGFVLNIDYFEDEDTLVFYSTLADIPEAHRLTLYEAMLRANFQWRDTAGATICLDPELDLALLMASITAADLDASRLLTVIGHFTGLSMAWTARILELSGERMPDPARPAMDAPTAPADLA